MLSFHSLCKQLIGLDQDEATTPWERSGLLEKNHIRHRRDEERSVFNATTTNIAPIER